MTARARRSIISQVKAFLLQIAKKGRQQDKQGATATGPQRLMASEPREEPRPPTLCILGAGIGGLALAIGLIERGIQCTVYDGCECFSTVGAGIGLGPNALNAIDLIDSRFKARYDSVKTGNERAEFEHSVFDALYAEEGFGEKRGWTRGLVGAPYFTRTSAHRKDLLDIMTSFIPPGTVKFSKQATEVKQVGDMVVVTFADGEIITVDAVIGCDGVKGLTRQAVLGDIAPELVAAKYASMYIYRGIVPMKDAKEILGEHGGDAKWFMAKGKGVAIYPISEGSQENFVFFVHDQKAWEGGPGTIDCTKEEMIADLKGFDPRLLRLLDWASPKRWPIFHHPNTPIYYNRRICMLGDVAHASSPHQAAGAGQGLEDAVVLAHLLSLVKSVDQLEPAFSAYDAVRRPRATAVVQTSQDAGILYTFLDPEIGDNIQKVVDNANQRLHWIWQHDLKADQVKAEKEFLKQIGKDASGGTEMNSIMAPNETALVA